MDLTPIDESPTSVPVPDNSEPVSSLFPEEADSSAIEPQTIEADVESELVPFLADLATTERHGSPSQREMESRTETDPARARPAKLETGSPESS